MKIQKIFTNNNLPIILGLCTANRCRSQMFEAIAKHYAQGKYNILSAGTKTTFVHPLAIKVLNEIGISTQNQFSKKMENLDLKNDRLTFIDEKNNQLEIQISKITKVITLCGSANESCPVFPGNVVREHWPIDDPDQYKGSEEEVLPHFRASRNDILERIKKSLA